MYLKSVQYSLKNSQIPKINSIVQDFMNFLSFYSTTFITCPAEANKTLAIKLPFLVMIIKNLKKYFTFEVQVTFIETLKI